MDNYYLDESHRGILMKFQSLQGELIVGKEGIKGIDSENRLQPDEFVPTQHILHDLIRGFYKPAGQPYLLSYQATEKEENYGKQIIWDEEGYSFNRIEMHPPSGEKDNRKKSDIAAARYNLENKIPIGVLQRVSKGKNRILGLGLITSERNDGVFIVEPFSFQTYKNSSTLVKEKVLENKMEFLLIKDLVNHIHSYIKSKGFYYEKEEVINLFLSLKTKPFVILSGISGTGKTKMVQWFAESLGATEENGQFHLIPIRPDWNDGSDLLGYKDIKGDFVEGPLTRIIKQANESTHLPFFVLLDEMNLARVEYYFSDILSVMESRKWQDDQIVTSQLLSKDMTGYAFDLRIPSNLYIVGTVNMDETTHPFSKKVLDRANTIEFNRVDLSNFSFLNETEDVPAIPVWNEKLASKYLHLKDVYNDHQELVLKTTDELEKINKSLQMMNAHVGYRVRDEICFYLAYNEEDQLMDYDEALDHCILQKILPRITGSDLRVERLLMELYRLFTNREFVDDLENDESDFETAKYPNSSRKVVEMLRRLKDDGFTSFWIS